MKTATLAVLAATAASALAADQSLCDKYSSALFNSTDGDKQLTLLTLLVNSAVIGNYSNATMAGGPSPTGIITTNGTYNGTSGINLAKYFDGSLKSTNRNGKAISVNFLDGGGAAPLKENKPANDTSSNQYTLLTHLYSYFGDLLGCTSVGSSGFPKYGGSTSMYEVHQFMNLDPNEVGYFIQEVAYSALSFGVTMSDVQAVGENLGKFFNNRCGNPISIPANATAAVQSTCLDTTCPIAQNGTCTSSNSGTNGTDPEAVSGSSSSGSGSSGSSSASGSGATSGSSSSGSSASGSKSGAASNKVASGIVGAVFAGAAFAAATLL